MHRRFQTFVFFSQVLLTKRGIVGQIHLYARIGNNFSTGCCDEVLGRRMDGVIVYPVQSLSLNWARAGTKECRNMIPVHELASILDVQPNEYCCICEAWLCRDIPNWVVILLSPFRFPLRILLWRCQYWLFAAELNSRFSSGCREGVAQRVLQACASVHCQVLFTKQLGFGESVAMIDFEEKGDLQVCTARNANKHGIYWFAYISFWRVHYSINDASSSPMSLWDSKSHIQADRMLPGSDCWYGCAARSESCATGREATP